MTSVSGDEGETTAGVVSTTDPATAEQLAQAASAEAQAQTAQDVDVIDAPANDSFAEYVVAWSKRIRSGESGVLPVLGGLVVIIIIFQTQSSVFLSARNLTNLLVQGAVFVMLGMAEVFVLLLGEIDLSIGYVAGVGAVVAVGLSAPPINLPWTVSIAAGLASTAAIGLIQGQLITRLRLPSFVVTLAGLLGWEGFLIFLINREGPNDGGTIRVTNRVIVNLVNGSLSPLAGWIVMAAAVIAYATLALARDRRRRATGLVTPPVALTVLKIVVMAAAGIALVAICNTNRGLAIAPLRGVPWVVLIVLGFLTGWTFLLGRTRFGRYIYAIGGNAEAARRAGVNLRKIRLMAFMLTGLTAGAAGIIYASRLGSISNNIDGGTLVLYAVASAVIGGTSLFGGRGKMIHALLGGLVIATIYNGMGLLGLSASTQYMVTALVLLAAVTVDAVARRGRTA
jgi:D-xylose transport system permease protein